MLKLSALIILFCLSIFYSVESDHYEYNTGGECYAKCIATDPDFPMFDYTFYTLKDSTLKMVYETKFKTLSMKKEKALWINAYKNSSREILWRIDSLNPEQKTIESLEEKELDFIEASLLDTINIEFKCDFKSDTLWQEVICNWKVDQDLLREISNKLRKDGVLVKEYKPEHSIEKFKDLNIEFREALKLYQIRYFLFRGEITVETLDHMKIDYQEYLGH